MKPDALHRDARGPRSAVVVATGDELTSGALVDANSSWIAARLFELGWITDRMHVLSDDEHALRALVRDASERHALVLVTGGLGPTLDDVTRHALAGAAGVELALDESVLAELRAYFERHKRPFAESNRRQALFPVGARVLANPHGTAPGFALRLGQALVCALPGPPGEMRPMFEAEVVPALAALAPETDVFAVRRFRLIGVAESAFADRAGDWMARDANPRMGVTSGFGTLSVGMRAHAASAAIADELVDARAAEFRARFAEWIYTEDERDLAAVVAATLIERGLSIAVAESCTGGLVAEKLTQSAGVSAVFEAGFVTYSNRAKSAMLGVEPALIEAHGAVSSEVAAAMALGAARRASARIAVSVTGIAGPGGGTPEKPVGLVWFGIACDGVVETHERRFPPQRRATIREFAAHAALDLVRRSIARW